MRTKTFIAIQALIVAFLLGFILGTKAAAGVDFGSSPISPAKQLVIVAAKVQGALLDNTGDDLEELRLEGLAIIGDQDRIIDVWNSVFTLAKSEVPQTASAQMVMAIRMMLEQEVGSGVKFGSYPIKEER